MSAGHLTIDLDAIVANWTALAKRCGSGVETAAVVKANAYGLGAAPVCRALAAAGARRFFVALSEEAKTVRATLGPDPQIFVFDGYSPTDRADFDGTDLIPLLNSPEQASAFVTDFPDAPLGLQLDTGMNRLGIEAEDLGAVVETLGPRSPALIMSHLACADEPDHPMNRQQLQNFVSMTASLPTAPRSFAATGGILLGPDYHFDLTRPGVGLYGGQPFADAQPVISLDVPVIQTRTVRAGEPVGYGNAWTAPRDTRVATIAAGYADGLARALANGLTVRAGDTPCPVIGRISMDLITVDVSALPDTPQHLTVLDAIQTIDTVAACGNTIGYEVLTSLGQRYARRYIQRP